MRTVQDIMTTDVVWVSPSARVKTAVILMTGHDIGILPVVETDESVAGIITYRTLLGAPDDAYVRDVMSTEFTAVSPDFSIYDAADLMHEHRVRHLVVVDNNKLVGVLSQGDLLPELSKNFDPLTGLPWSDSFRAWAMSALKRGQEISVIFFDLDQFGHFNKVYGHVIGDTVLKQVANVFKQLTDRDLDLACRYGGDEFAVVSLRRHDEAIELAEAIKERIGQIQIDGLEDGISGTYGISGGRRTKEREDMHYAATIDDLVTRASKECIKHKPHPVEPEAEEEVAPTLEPVTVGADRDMFLPQPAAAGSRLQIQTIRYSSTGPEAHVGVVLQKSGHKFERDVSGYIVEGKNVLRLVAEAAAGAVCKSLGPGYGIVVDDVLVYDISDDDRAISVVATFVGPRWTVKHVGSSIVRRGDLYRSACAALLSAVNRLVEVAPRAVEQNFDEDEEDQSEE